MNEERRYDVIVVGAGPAGSTCAALCAEAGLSTLLLDRARFPRDKVCGDCLNPSCWRVFRRLGIVAEVEQLVHARLEAVEFIPMRGRGVTVSLINRGEISVKRSLLDHLLVKHAISKGVEVREETTVTGLDDGWSVSTTGGKVRAGFVIGADGRNSLIARLSGLRDVPFVKERVALQTHLELPEDFRRRVILRLFPFGYAGYSDVGGNELNLCLVGAPKFLGRLKSEAERIFQIPVNRGWRSVTPIARSSLTVATEGLFLVGDAAKVVEPFTGEGIYYALQSGELAAGVIVDATRKSLSVRTATKHYCSAHSRMYKSRLWVNRLARVSVTQPWVGDSLIRMGRVQPWLLRYLTSKVAGAPSQVE